MFSVKPLLLLALIGGGFASPLSWLHLRQAATSSTRNDFLEGGCKKYIVIYARGTTEQGNVGLSAGPPFFDALLKKVNGDLAVQGVDYPANWGGAIIGGDVGGTKTMAGLVQQAVTKCPGMTIVMSGYSQGAQLVHKAANSLSANILSNVSSAVVFGDPYNGQAVNGVTNLLSVCHIDDSICEIGGGQGTGGHTGYAEDAEKAAAFVVKYPYGSTPMVPTNPSDSISIPGAVTSLVALPLGIPKLLLDGVGI